jgi:hypothetical protein
MGSPGCRIVGYDALATNRRVFDSIDCPVVALVDSAVEPSEPGLAELARLMMERGASVAFGTLKSHRGRIRPPARIEDLRYREPGSTRLTLVTLAHARRIASEVGSGEDDPFFRWRFARHAAERALVCSADIAVGTLRSANTSSAMPIPIDLAGTGAEQSVRSDLILIYGEIDASVSLYFDGVPVPLKARLRFLRPSTPVDDLPHFLAASLVIVVRSFEHLMENGTVDLLDAMRVPYAWFVDDNFVSLAADQDGFAYYSAERVSEFVLRTCGVLASTEVLAEAMTRFGRPVLHWPCVFDDSLATTAPRQAVADELIVGVIGGSFRRRDFADHLLPALATEGLRRRIEVRARFDLIHGLGGISVIAEPMQSSFRQFVYRWQTFGCDVVAHPRGEAANMPYKSLATLLAARYLGAVPLVGRDSVHTGLGPSEGVCVASSSSDGWAQRLAELSEPAYRRQLFDNLDVWCRKTFDPSNVLALIPRLDAWSSPATVSERDARLRRAMALPNLHSLGRPPKNEPLALQDIVPFLLYGARPFGFKARARLAFRTVARAVAVRTGTFEHFKRIRVRLFANKRDGRLG